MQYFPVVIMEREPILESDLSQLSIKNEEMKLIEDLPYELLWEIFDRTPESISNIRLISRLFKSLVDEYALSRKCMRLVDYVQFNFESGNARAMSVVINIEERFKNLFELRFKLRNPDIELTRRLQRADYGVTLGYFLEFNVVNDQSYLMLLRETMGESLKTVIVNENSNFNQAKSSFVSAFLEDVHFDKLQCQFNYLSEQKFTFLVNLMANGNLRKLHLMVEYVTLADPVESLVRLSSLATTISVTQLSVNGLAEDALLFFGKTGFNWAPTFIEMMNRRCDKLNVHSDYAQFMQKDHADLLKEKLPKIKKKIWFCTSCECYEDKFEYTENGSEIKYVKCNNFERFLSVKHLLRVGE
ncbi:hypothetical protein PMAYCL1PPCAC_20227, partial [Pristionchus mayeri]